MAIFGYGFALLAIVLCAKTFPLILLLIPLLGRHAYQDIRLNCLRLSPEAIVYYQQISKDRWRLKTRAGKSIVVRPCTKAFRSKYFVKISFQRLPFKRRIELVVAFDAITEAHYTYLVSSLWDQD